MKKKLVTIFMVCVICLSFFTISTNAANTSASLDVPLYAQNDNDTCADAAARMCIGYYVNFGYGTTIPSEATMVNKYGKGSHNPIIYGIKDYCNIQFAYTSKPSSLSAFTNLITNNINNGNPVVLNVFFNKGSKMSGLVGGYYTEGHFIVVTGYTSSSNGFTLKINDPFDGASKVPQAQYRTLNAQDVYDVIKYMEVEQNGTIIRSNDTYITKFNSTAVTQNAYYTLASGKTSAVVRNSPHDEGKVIGNLTSEAVIHVSKKGTNGKNSSYWYYIDKGEFAGNYIYSGNVKTTSTPLVLFNDIGGSNSQGSYSIGSNNAFLILTLTPNVSGLTCVGQTLELYDSSGTISSAHLLKSFTFNDRLAIKPTVSTSFDLQKEFGYQLKPNTTYYYRFLVSLEDGKMSSYQYSSLYSFTTGSSSGGHTHTYSSAWSSNATNHWHACTGCTATSGLAAHSFSGWATSLEPTHTADGCKYRYCTVCGYTEYATIPATGHTYNQQNTSSTYLKSAATCTQPAVYYYSCSCGAKGTNTFTYGSATGHTYNQQNTSSTYLKSAATCTQPAVYYYSCSCGAKGTSTFTSGSALGHNYQNGVCTRCKQADPSLKPVTGSPTMKCDSTYEAYHVGDSVTVTWNSVPNATKYEYYVTEFPEGWAYLKNVRHDTVTTTKVTLTGLPAGHYAMFIHAENDISMGPQSEWISFDVYEKEYLPIAQGVYNGHIYAVYDYECAWSFAYDLCNNFGGHLVTITDAKETAFVNDLIAKGKKDAYWIGLTDYSQNADKGDGAWTWASGEKYSYTNWKSGEPSHSGGTAENREHWAEIRKSYNNQWNDTTNTNIESKGFILEIEPSDKDVTATGTYNGNKYLIIDHHMTWTEAALYCKQKGGHLLFINDTKEEAFIDSFISNGTRDWYFIGGIKRNGEWYWNDGDKDVGKVTLTNWYDHQFGAVSDRLVKYNSIKQYTSFDNCYGTPKHMWNMGFICEIENGADTPVVPPVVPPVNPGTGGIKIPNIAEIISNIFQSIINAIRSLFRFGA